MENEEFLVDSTLCFINSAKPDYSYESLFDVAYAFYSHEDIKNAKGKICILLKKDIVWRRDPEKKKKDLRDLLEYHDEFKAVNKHVKFVTSSHKKMPPIGLEMFAPILTKLAEDVIKLNEVLPKILDIKSEICNTADTVRQMHMDVNDLKSKFAYAVTGMEGAAKNLSNNEVDFLKEIRSFRQSLGSIRDSNEIINMGSGSVFDQVYGNDMNSLLDIGRSYADIVAKPQLNARVNSPKKDSGIGNSSPVVLVTEPKTGAVSKKIQGDKKQQISKITPSKKEKETEKRNYEDSAEEGEERDWTLVDRNWKKKRQSPRSAVNTAKEKPSNYRLLGSRRDAHSTMRAVRRTADVFIGRVDRQVEAENVSDYIKEHFDVKVQNIEKVEIQSKLFNAFKVTVFLENRDKLFNAELWPEGIIVNKFYKRRS